MKIKCPDCSTSYDIKPEALGESGRSVKCARCGNRWHVSPKRDDDELKVEPPVQPEEKDEADWASDSADEEKSDGFDFDSDDRDDEDDEPEPVVAAKNPPATKPAAYPARPEPKNPSKDGAQELDAAGKPIDIESMANRPKIKVNPNKFRRDRIGAIFRWLLRRNFRRIGGIGLFVGAIGLCAFLLTIRATLVKQAPDLASLFEIIGMDVNLRGLEFRDLRTFREVEEGQEVLVVEGSIRNIIDDTTPVPAVRLSIRGTDLQEIYAWTVEPRTKILKALDETRFRTILADPPLGASDIQVRFIDRGLTQNVLE